MTEEQFRQAERTAFAIYKDATAEAHTAYRDAVDRARQFFIKSTEKPAREYRQTMDVARRLRFKDG